MKEYLGNKIALAGPTAAQGAALRLASELARRNQFATRRTLQGTNHAVRIKGTVYPSKSKGVEKLKRLLEAEPRRGAAGAAAAAAGRRRSVSRASAARAARSSSPALARWAGEERALRAEIQALRAKLAAAETEGAHAKRLLAAHQAAAVVFAPMIDQASDMMWEMAGQEAPAMRRASRVRGAGAEGAGPSAA